MFGLRVFTQPPFWLSTRAIVQIYEESVQKFTISNSMKLLDTQFPHPLAAALLRHRKFKTHLFRAKEGMIMMTTLREMAECQRKKARSQGDQVILSYMTHVSMCPRAGNKRIQRKKVIIFCSAILPNDAGEAS